MNLPATPRIPLLTRGTLAAAAVMACAALVFFVTHGYQTGWRLTGEHWDAGYYFKIATSGYRADPTQALLAFLPGYPIFLAPAAQLLPNHPFLASFITSSILSIIGGAALYRLLRRRLDAWTSLAGIALLAFSPFSIYLYNGYSESAFLLAAALALVWLAGGRPVPAALATGYAFLCRPYALALAVLFIPVAWRLLRERDIWKLGWIVVLGTLPTLLYCAYLYHAFGDPFIPLKSLADWHKYQSISHAWPRPIRTLYAFLFAFRDSSPGSWSLSLAMYPLAACATLAAAARLPARLVVYSLLVLACVYLTDALIPLNLGRHAMLAFATGPALAAVIYGRERGPAWTAAAQHAAFAIAFLFFMGTFIVMGIHFSLGQWVS
ncbi:MAG TPA: hypothetical protein VFY94_02885 [Rhodanobacteraceae bacterium]|nr:hypothetical protein [Rhodanobacteraceae bacterium]